MAALRLLLCLLLLLPAVATAAPLVAFQPFGDIDPALVKKVVEHVRSTFDVDVVTLPAQALPADAWYPPRARWRGEVILTSLESRTPAHVSKVLGLTDRDLSTSKGDLDDWGIIGLAELSRRAAVVSTYRLGRTRALRERMEMRLSRVAEHELGHTFGIPHCSTPRCVMNDACGSIRTVDRSRGSFCPACRRRLGALLRDDPTQRAVAGGGPGTRPSRLAMSAAAK